MFNSDSNGTTPTMQKDHNNLNKIFGLSVFLTSFILYLSTMPPTTSFWDCAERIACSYLLQIPHPPGAPLYLIMGRVFSMLAPPELVAYSINMMSVLASSFSILFLYLIIVRFVREFKGDPNTYDLFDKVGLYAGGIIGAITFAVSDSFWFTAVEAEAYAISLMFTSLVVWLALKWAEQHNRPRAERWIVLIAYVLGLAFGVHLLSLLSVFTVALIVYFKKYDFTIVGFLTTAAVAVAIFFSIFPFTIIYLPTIAEAFPEWSGGLLGPSMFFILLLVFIVGGVYYTHTKKLRLANIIFIAYACILIGYSSYTLIFVRSMAQPPIDQNSPDTVESFISYLKREQYGATPLLRGNTYNNELGEIDRNTEKLFPRRHSREARHLAKYAEYSSDFDYFVRYQIGHMYFRYFAWNFIGRDADTQDAAWISGFQSTINKDNPGHNRFFYLPFLLGFIGMMFHFRRDWKSALSVMALFLATGVAIVFYVNQFPFQPRERDYSYTGSFFAFSIWIGIGASGVIFMLKEAFRSKIAGAYGTAAILFAGVPFWMAMENYHDHDRSLQYVAPDYAYNLLNSLAPYAIVFTNGDNDTFPLWYLQDVEGVRRDVRVVNLSLLNTTWYIKQMKNKWNYEAPPVPISLSDEQVNRIEDKFRFERPGDFHTPRIISIPVDKNRLRLIFEDSTRIAEGINSPIFLDQSAESPAPVSFAPEMSFGVPVDQLDNEVAWFYSGNFLGTDRSGNELYYTRIQDDMVLDILRTNRWERPVYFAITVAQDGQLDLQPYFRLEGKAFRVVPARENPELGGIDPVIHGERLRTFRFREIDNDKAYFDENIRRMVDNYRTIISRQAAAWADLNQLDSARYWMRWGEENIPFETIEGDMTSLVSYAYRYAQYGERDRSVALARLGLDRLRPFMMHNVNRINAVDDQIESLQNDIRTNRTNVSRRQRLESQLRNVSSSRESIVREISFDSSRYMILQSVFFMAGLDDEAQAVAFEVDQMTSGRVPFPQTREENRTQVRRIFGD
jgi:hypothetical protein